MKLAPFLDDPVTSGAQEEAMQEFCWHLFDRPKLNDKVGKILEALLEARSLRISDLSHRMPGSPSARQGPL